MGLTIEQWDELDDYQRAYALAPDLIDAERNAGRCTQCGGPASVCQDPDNQHAFKVTFRRCYLTMAREEAAAKRSDHVGVVAVIELDPTRKKSARAKEGGRG